MAKIAPSTRASATLSTELMALWVVLSCPCVWLRYCSATRAPPLVLTLNDMEFSVLVTRLSVLLTGFLPRCSMARRVPEAIQKSLTIDWECPPANHAEAIFVIFDRLGSFCLARRNLLPSGRQ